MPFIRALRVGFECPRRHQFHGRVAQLERAGVLQTSGRRFDPVRDYHSSIPYQFAFLRKLQDAIRNPGCCLISQHDMSADRAVGLVL